MIKHPGTRMTSLLLACWLTLSAATAVAAPFADVSLEATPVPAQLRIDVGFSPDGDAQRRVLGLIGAARQSIHLAGYAFTSRPVVAALLAAQRRGVEVALVVDDKSSRQSAGYAALTQLADAGIAVRTNDVYAIHHDKYIVVDGRHVETGSFNYTDSAARRNSENVLIVWNDPALAQQYLQHWQSRWRAGRPYR